MSDVATGTVLVVRLYRVKDDINLVSSFLFGNEFQMTAASGLAAERRLPLSYFD